ncbi:hypothetical protein CAEBREN_08149 [Caenorhabditis brenneri]|uniref:Ephrin RBD domain-containing protein n=1 Tax=Caenorhabditis brenneri TaxID=135651 RepID=G0PD16_CAEBE|nr:hypothetical protein CAEBREN_08149 [Caenorhabditis brenneri]
MGSSYVFGYMNGYDTNHESFRNEHPTIEVRMGDVVRFVCPDNADRDEGEYLIVYEVTEFSMTDCALESTATEIIKCGVDTKKAPEPKNVAHLIRQLNPLPNGKEYITGQTYYYMTTSSGKANGLNHRMVGLCGTRNMRIAMKVLPSQPTPAPYVKPMTPTRRQEDFVTKSSAEMTDGQEDEDSENDNAHLLPRDLDVASNPKFRRPSQFEQAAASAGVHDKQLFKVIQMAKEGKTGTFENEKIANSHSSLERDQWNPVNVQYVTDLMNTAFKNAEDRISYQRDDDFMIHEENDIAMKTLGYSSSVSSIPTLFVILLVALLLF